MKSQPMRGSAFADSVTDKLSAKADPLIGCDFMSLSASAKLARMRTRKTARRDKVEIYLHLMWTTWDRMPLIQPAWEYQIYGVLHSVVDKNGCFLIASGGMPDHVHLLVSIRSTTRTCDLMKDLKGTSARFGMDQSEFFKWRPTYAAFSVSRWDTEMIKNYLLNQKVHHAEGTADEILECADETYWYDD